jgi:hypothetical protein
VCERYGIKHNGETFLFADINATAEMSAQRQTRQDQQGRNTNSTRPQETQNEQYTESVSPPGGFPPIELVRTYRYLLEITDEIPFEVIFVGIDNPQRFDADDLELFINVHIRNVKTWLEMSTKQLGQVLGDRDIPPEV